MRKRSYQTIAREIDELERQGYDRPSIEAILEAKYKESNIERIRTEARWEEEKQQEKLEKKNERKAETTAETVEKITPYIVLVVTIIVALFMIFFVFPAIDGCFAAVETLTE